MKKTNTKKQLWEACPICFVCKRRINSFRDVSLEHIIPKSKGGLNKNTNISISHHFCNQIKDDLTSRIEWEKKLYDHENDVSLILRRKMTDFQTEFSIILFTLCFVESHYIENYEPQKNLIHSLRHTENLSTIIEASAKIHHFQVPDIWELIFGIIFLEHFLKTKDLLAFLHSIWRFSRFQLRAQQHNLAPFNQVLMEICKNINYPAYEKFFKQIKIYPRNNFK